VLSEDAKIKERQRYFSKLLNGEVMEDSQSREREGSERRLGPRVCGPISKEEIKEALREDDQGEGKGFRSDTGGSVEVFG